MSPFVRRSFRNDPADFGAALLRVAVVFAVATAAVLAARVTMGPPLF